MTDSFAMFANSILPVAHGIDTLNSCWPRMRLSPLPEFASDILAVPLQVVMLPIVILVGSANSRCLALLPESAVFCGTWGCGKPSRGLYEAIYLIARGTRRLSDSIHGQGARGLIHSASKVLWNRFP